ncbi:sulfur transfer complex subunit TusB [Actinobacillus ureae]|uniref:Sulfur relay protein TusB/DsrH n=1 Tax=Actinobacillus ureae ATCC 25976 TaxID=887324 RepID=E8KE97_9PAST|nr:DsrH/TusB family sulfur metabolism protein [Actinobacillus ureae]EFX92776.1 sulfur relay protein TusB/DsrH [Actinobacillus ureae ATCC 25976]SUT87994.1 sulfur transfer complex subunit TusB [Actinobacillus ureae]SUU49813.1 sulfur transfer complex subunit TusB [Actinobacillus ureae]
MLYTLSKAQYDLNELTPILAQITENDALVLWQDGVLLAVKYPQLFTKISHLFILTNDIEARGLSPLFKSITLTEFVKITETFYPQVAL